MDAILRSGIRRFTDEVRPLAPLHCCRQPGCRPAPTCTCTCTCFCSTLLTPCLLLPPSPHPPPLRALQVGRLWTSLADYFIRRGMFERARDVYDEGLTSVITVRDFSLVYDALTQVRGVGRAGGWAVGRGLGPGLFQDALPSVLSQFGG